MNLPDGYSTLLELANEFGDEVAISMYWEPDEPAPVRMTVGCEDVSVPIGIYLSTEDAIAVANALLMASALMENLSGTAQAEIDRLRQELIVLGKQP